MNENVLDQECIKITEVYLRKVNAPWLIEDPQFREAVKAGWDICDTVSVFVSWMGHFLDSLSRDQSYLVERVSAIRIMNWLKSGEILIKNGRFVKVGANRPSPGRKASEEG